MMRIHTKEQAQPVLIDIQGVVLEADLSVPPSPRGLVIFAHGSGSSRFSPRNRAVAESLNEASLATLLMDLLTLKEQDTDDITGHLRFDIDLLSARLAGSIDWARIDPRVKNLRIGLFGASTGAAAALTAAAQRPNDVAAVVSRGGRPDLAGASLGEVCCPVLLIVGGYDDIVIELNQRAAADLKCVNEIAIVPQATHLFEEPGKLEVVADLARQWFSRHLAE